MDEIGFSIDPWSQDHPRWHAAQTLIDALGQTDWMSFQAGWHLASVCLVAKLDEEPVGFLRFVVQPIGPDADCPALEFRGEILKEAKILAFGVRQDQRRKGIGKRLQVAAIESAQDAGCYQIRSYSAGNHPENHQLKQALGFGAHPVVRANGENGIYYVLPLRAKDSFGAV
jgi:GNAT superfamily N-acetyltransferase